MPARSREAWNDEDHATLRQMAREGASIVEIARKLERTQEATRMRAARLKIEIRRER